MKANYRTTQEIAQVALLWECCALNYFENDHNQHRALSWLKGRIMPLICVINNLMLSQNILFNYVNKA